MTFFIVPFSDGTERVFNANVQNEVLLRFIKGLLNLQPDELIDLLSDSGEPLELHLRPTDYARRVIEPKSVCFIAKVIRESPDSAPVYVPFFNSNTVTEPFRPFIGKKARKLSQRRLIDDDEQILPSSVNLRDRRNIMDSSANMPFPQQRTNLDTKNPRPATLPMQDKL